jgi:acyl carrier protein
MSDNTRDTLARLVTEIFELDSVADLKDETLLSACGDSLQHLELQAAIEVKFARRIELGNIASFGQLVGELGGTTANSHDSH